MEKPALIYKENFPSHGVLGFWGFLVYEWPWVQEWRAGFGLDPKDLHITLGFSDQDIFKMADGKTQVSKDASTCVW